MTVTIVAILAGLGAVAGVLGVLAGSVIHGLSSLDPTETTIVLGALALASLYGAVAYAAWTLRPWGWTLGVVAGVATIAYMAAVLIRGWADLMVDAPPLAVFGLLVLFVAAVALFFWLRPDVKAAFGRSSA